MRVKGGTSNHMQNTSKFAKPLKVCPRTTALVFDAVNRLLTRALVNATNDRKIKKRTFRSTLECRVLTPAPTTERHNL